MSDTVIDRVLVAVAVATAIVSVLLLLWALAGDRARGRRRCPRCWYQLGVAGSVASVPLQCSECGHRVSNVRKLSRTRRRWRSAVVACLIGLIAATLAVAPGARLRGWPGAIPSTVMVSVWPVSVEDWVAKSMAGRTINDPVISELDRRIQDGELWNWQQACWVSRVESWFDEQGRLGIERERMLLEKLLAARITCDFSADRLEDVIAALNRDFESATGIPKLIQVVWEDEDREGISRDALVSLHLTDSDGVAALDALAYAYSMGWGLSEDTVELALYLASGDDRRLCSYDLTHLMDLVAPADSDAVTPLQVAAMQTEIISLIDRFGVSALMVGSRLLMFASVRDHHGVEALLRSLEHASTDRAACVAVDTAEWSVIDKTRAKLGASLTFKGDSLAIDELFNALSLVSDVPFDVDWASLHHLNIQPALHVETTPGQLTVEGALNRYLRNLTGEWSIPVVWTIRHGVVRITTSRRLSTGHHYIVRVYNLSALADKITENQPGAVPADIARRVRGVVIRTIDPDGWVENGGDRADVHLLGPLLVVQSPLVSTHWALETLLAEARSNPGLLDAEPLIDPLLDDENQP